jgi:hypothetical protein
MNVEEFILTTSRDQPPAGLVAVLQALWHVRKGDWGRAHAIVQNHDDDLSCAWVHAHIHRIEGDMGNAGYWYRRVGRQFETRGLEEEWKALVAHFLAAR